MEPDPLRTLVSRALHTTVDGIAVERLAASPLVELDRITWRGPEGEGRILFKRMARAASVEAALVPALARRGFPVPQPIASGIPPAHVREPRPWLLLLEPEGASLCDDADDGAARRAGEALRALQDATVADAPTLAALGVPSFAPERVRAEALEAAELVEREAAEALRAAAEALDVAALAAAGTSLVNGDLTCANVLVGRDGLVVVDWSLAHVGCALTDVGSLAAGLGSRDPARADAFVAAYGRGEGLVAEAELLHRLFLVRTWAAQAREGLRPLSDARRRIALAVGTPS